VDLIESVILRAKHQGEAIVSDSRPAAQAVVAQLEGAVLFAKLYNDTSRLDDLWANSLALLGAPTPEPAGS
jgi:TetR/AcrR family transcriptional repressor of nem operon